MSIERRYSEPEIEEIFKKAAKAQTTAQRHVAAGEGLTLRELQQIGSDVGITPEFIARAAAAVDRTVDDAPAITSFGLPLTVARAADLPRSLSDDDWNRLVVDLRDTFNASGRIRRDGTLREWRNGNLHALVEPTDSGDRLRLRTLHGNAKGALLGGLGFFAINLAFLLIYAFAGKVGMNGETLMLAMLCLMGLGTMGIAAYQLPRWAKERARQMENILERAAERMTAGAQTRKRESASTKHGFASPELTLDAQRDEVKGGRAAGPTRTRS